MKKLILGLIIGLLLGVSSIAFAAIGDTVTAVFAQFTYKVNGEAKPIDSPVLVYEGTSYLRTTDIANLLGYDVTYRADGRTIEFSGGPAPTTPEPTQTPVVEQSTEPAVSTAPTQEPTQTQPQLVEPNPTPTTEPAPEQPAPSNTAACQAIRDDYAGKIAMVQYGPGSLGKHKQQVLLLEYERDQKLSASGCQ